MSEKFRVVEKTKTEDIVKKDFKNHSNPITRNLVNFSNSKIGEKFSVKDLLR